jgi:hypothetical protein
VSGGLDSFVVAAPWPQRAGLRALLALGRRPRGKAVLRLLAPADQLASSLLALERYDDPAFGKTVGWDAAAIVERGRRLRASEGRP